MEDKLKKYEKYFQNKPIPLQNRLLIRFYIDRLEIYELEESEIQNSKAGAEANARKLAGDFINDIDTNGYELDIVPNTLKTAIFVDDGDEDEPVFYALVYFKSNKNLLELEDVFRDISEYEDYSDITVYDFELKGYQAFIEGELESGIIRNDNASVYMEDFENQDHSGMNYYKSLIKGL
jgi:hypothetical protein